MASRLSTPVIKVTSLSKLILGDDSCEFSAWFPSHYQYEEIRSRADWLKYRVDHTALLNRARSWLESHGKMISSESQNGFGIKGKVATLKGEPDLVALGDTCIVCEVKTGKKRLSDKAQVLIYMWLLPYAYPKFRGLPIEGLVIYEDCLRPVPATSLTDKFKHNLIELIKRIGSSTEARKVPSFAECQRCNIGKEHCADRIEEPEGLVTTDLF